MHQSGCNSLYEENGICNCKPIEVSVYDELYAESTHWLGRSYTKTYPERPELLTGALSYIEGNNFIHTRMEAVIEEIPHTKTLMGMKIELSPGPFVGKFQLSEHYLFNSESKKHVYFEIPYGLFIKNYILYVYVAKVSEHPLLAAMRDYCEFISNKKNLINLVLMRRRLDSKNLNTSLKKDSKRAP